MKEDLYSFYKGSSCDRYGRSINEILEKDNQWLENTHNYIQRLFPTTIPSMYDFTAPILTSELIIKMKADQTIIQNMQKAFYKMLQFYELEIMEDHHQLQITFSDKRPFWVFINNHNYKRISRILYSLRLFDLNKEANAFYQCLENFYHKYPFLIGKQTYHYWNKYITCEIKTKEGI